MRQIVFIIKPENDACDRCKVAAYVNGRDSSDGYNVHVVPSAQFKQTAIIHKHCRCIAVEVTDLEGVDGAEFVDENTVDLVNETGLPPNKLGGEIPSSTRHSEVSLNPGRHFSKLIRHHHKKRNIGETFFTIAVEPIVNMINSFMRIFGKG